ncbi:MAG: leucine-rich repeat protein [Lachnospiraceae bacterium]|nr:leucine-rich repeat protein [Lachnospiraceae bacterium]
MTTVIVLIILFVILLTLPLAVAFIYYAASKGKVMKINQDILRDQRYFAHSFSGMIERSLPTAEDNKIKLSRTEHYDDAEAVRRRVHQSTVENLVIETKDSYVSPKHVKYYEKEIYAAGDAAFETPGLTLRAAYAKKHMRLGNGTNVIRWVDAEETLSVYDDCNLGISATAGKILSVGKNCAFRRLYAPVVYFGQYPENLIDPMKGRDEQVFMLPIIDEKKKIKHVTHENMTEEGTAPYSIVTPTRTVMIEDAILQGNIHTVGNVRICSGSGVLGGVFSEGNILLEKGSFVVGNVFAQGKIEIEENVMIGKSGSMISVISRGPLTVGENVVIYGYVSSEEGGKVCPLYSEEKERHAEEYEYIEYQEEPVVVSFENLHDFEVVDDAVFRKNKNVIYAELPEGAKKIRRSMFCECTNLERLNLPDTITEIEDFGLYSCKKLSGLTSFAGTKLKRIGTSGMEYCGLIQELAFPAAMEEIGPAACAGMTRLAKVTFAEGCRLRALYDHSFRDCSSLTELILPDTVSKIGISSFRGCTALEFLSVPKTVESEPGITELKEILPNVKVEFRA